LGIAERLDEHENETKAFIAERLDEHEKEAQKRLDENELA
jgi:hypothetical protein